MVKGIEIVAITVFEYSLVILHLGLLSSPYAPRLPQQQACPEEEATPREKPPYVKGAGYHTRVDTLEVDLSHQTLLIVTSPDVLRACPCCTDRIRALLPGSYHCVKTIFNFALRRKRSLRSGFAFVRTITGRL
jgi:hypothetical protein